MEVSRETFMHSEKDNLFDRVVSISALIALLIKADGHVANKEVKLASKYLRKYGGWWVLGSFSQRLKSCLQAADSKGLFEKSCQTLAKNMNYTEKVGVVEMLFDIARLGNALRPVEWDFLHKTMEKLDVEARDISYFSHKYPVVASSDKETAELTLLPYNILGVEVEATPEEIHSSYLLLEAKYNPDTVEDNDLKMVLSEKLKEIQSAYEVLKKGGRF